MKDYLKIIIFAVQIIIVLIFWYVAINVWVQPKIIENNRKAVELINNKKKLMNIDFNNKLSVKKKQNIEKILTNSNANLAKNLQSIQLYIIKLAEDNNLKNIYTGEKITDKKTNKLKYNYSEKIIKSQLSGNYYQYWSFRKQLSKLKTLYKTIYEKISKDKNGQLLIDMEILILINN